MGRIQEIQLKIKNEVEEILAEWGILAVVVFVGLASFGLGRLSAIEEARPAISVTEAQASAAALSITPGGLVVASRQGSAYHYPWCSGASTIKEGNKVWFESEEAARRAGYEPARNCKGL